MKCFAGWHESVRTSVIAWGRGKNGSLIQSFLDAFHWSSRRNGEVSVGRESTVNFPSRLALYSEDAPIILLKRRWQMIRFDDSVEWQLWTSLLVIELNFLLLKSTSTLVKPVGFVNWSKEDPTQLTWYWQKIRLCLQTKFIIEWSNKSSQSGRDCLCLVKARTESGVQFTILFYQLLSSRWRREAEFLQLSISLELKMSSRALSCVLSDLSHVNYRCPWRVWYLIIKSKFFLGWVISRSRLNYEWSLLISLLLVVYRQEGLGRSLSVIFNEFLF